MKNRKKLNKKWNQYQERIATIFLQKRNFKKMFYNPRQVKSHKVLIINLISKKLSRIQVYLIQIQIMMTGQININKINISYLKTQVKLILNKLIYKIKISNNFHIYLLIIKMKKDILTIKNKLFIIKNNMKQN